MKNIAIVCGGYSGEYEISIKSAGVVAKNIDKKKYNPYLIEITKEGWFWKNEKGERVEVDKNDFTLNTEKGRIYFDGVFNAIHGTPGEDGKLQGYLEMLGIPYTSCDVLSSALTFDKFICNKLVNTFEIETARSFSFLKNDFINKNEVFETLGFPVFVKPSQSGSSVGVYKVNNEKEFDIAIENAFKIYDRILVEEYIKGREIACGIIKKGKELLVFPLTEIISKKDFFDYEAKYSEGMADEITPADVTVEVETEIKTTSVFLYKQMNCKGFVRFDYILSGEKIYFLEVNSIPGISEASIMPKQAETFGLSIDEFFEIAIENMFLQE